MIVFVLYVFSLLIVQGLTEFLVSAYLALLWRQWNKRTPVMNKLNGIYMRGWEYLQCLPGVCLSFSTIFQ